MSEADGFLARWSRRKRVAQAEEPAAEPVPPEQAPREVPVAEAAAPEVTEPPPDLADLPPVESLTPDSDLAPFLRPGVPAALKNAALRRMWLLDPVIAGHRDVALDYAWDFNGPDAIPGFGGTITPDSVQTLLDSLSGPAEQAAPVNRVGSTAVADPVAPPDHGPAAEVAAVADGGSLPAVVPACEPQPPRPATAGPAPKLRRHGGAAPV